MRKLDILFIDSGLSITNIENVLSNELQQTIFNISSFIRNEIHNKSDLSIEIRKFLDFGKVLSKELIEKMIIKNLNETDGNLILTRYPRTSEQFLELQKTLNNENIIIDKIWFFKLRNHQEFMKKHFENPLNKKYLEKYGNEILDNWLNKFLQTRKNIDNIKNAVNNIEWKNIEMDYYEKPNFEYIKESIINCA
jgi:adenylate kinase family enzyme